MSTFRKTIIIGALLLNSSCGLVDAELFIPRKTDLNSLTPPPVTTPPSSITKLDSWGYGGSQFDLVISGNYIVSANSRGLSTFDISDPYFPKEINTLKSYSANYITKIGDLAFVSYNNGIFEAYDISTPTNPASLSSLSLTFPHKVVNKGSIVYVPDGTSGLRVIDFSDPTNMQLLNTVDTNGSAVQVTLDGNYLFLADGSQGVKIFDISAPQTPNLIGTYLTADDSADIKVKGNYAYIAVPWNSIDILDISNKSNPVLIQSYMDYHNYYNGFQQLDIQGNNLLTIDYYNGLIVYDISNPTTLITKGTATPYATRWWGEPHGYAYNGTHFFIAAETYGIGTLDFSNATLPHIPYSYRGVEWWTNAVAVTGNRAYVCENNWGRLTILDISVPSSPSYLGETPLGQSVCSKQILHEGGHVFATAGNSGLKIIDVTTESAPTVVATVDHGSNARNLQKQNNYVYVVYDSIIYIYDVTVPTAPTVAGSYTYGANDIVVEGNYAYLAGTNTLRIINISNPASITLVGTYNFPSGTTTTYSIAKSGNNVIVGGNENIAIIDVSTPASPLLLYKSTGFDTPNDIEVWNDNLYVCTYDTGVLVFDIVTPGAPRLSEVYPLGGCLGIHAKADALYIADEASGLKILNASSKAYLKMSKPGTIMSLSSLMATATKTYLADSFFGLVILKSENPKQPEYLSRIELNTIIAPPIEDGTTLYVADQYQLRSYDITDPQNPVVLSQVDRSSTSYISRIAKVGNLIYALENSSLTLFDVSNPSNMTPTGSFAYTNLRNLTVSGNMMLISSLSTGLRVFDISTPSSPILQGTYNSPGTAYHAIQDGSYAYLADGSAGLQVVDLSNPAIPVAVGNYNTPGTAQMVAKKNQYIFISDAGHVEVVDVSNPTAPILKTTINKSLFGNRNAKGVSIRDNYLYIELYNGYEVFDISDIDNIHQ